MCVCVCVFVCVCECVAFVRACLLKHTGAFANGQKQRATLHKSNFVDGRDDTPQLHHKNNCAFSDGKRCVRVCTCVCVWCAKNHDLGARDKGSHFCNRSGDVVAHLIGVQDASCQNSCFLFFVYTFLYKQNGKKA